MAVQTLRTTRFSLRLKVFTFLTLLTSFTFSSVAAQTVNVRPVRATTSLPPDVDDPAIWFNRRNPPESLIVGTIKTEAPDGGLGVFGLDGKLRQTIRGLDYPNNVDVEYDLMIQGTLTDIAVTTERFAHRLRIYAIQTDRGLRDISGHTSVLDDQPGRQGEPMGIGLFKRPIDGVIFAIVAPKDGPRDGYLWEYRLDADRSGRVNATFIRRFGSFSGRTEIEAVVVDDELGYVYYADELAGIHKWPADPDTKDADRELAFFGTRHYAGEREGLAIYAGLDGTGYIASVDQVPDNSTILLYRREGEPGRPHDHSSVVGAIRIGADDTDGIEVTSSAISQEFQEGLLVAMNSNRHNFFLVRWRDIDRALGLSTQATAEPLAGSRLESLASERELLVAISRQLESLSVVLR